MNRRTMSAGVCSGASIGVAASPLARRGVGFSVPPGERNAGAMKPADDEEDEPAAAAEAEAVEAAAWWWWWCCCCTLAGGAAGYGLALSACASNGEPFVAGGAGHIGEKGWPSDGTPGFSKEAAASAGPDLSAAGLLALAADEVAVGAATGAGASSASRQASRATRTTRAVRGHTRRGAQWKELCCKSQQPTTTPHAHACGAQRKTKGAARQRTLGRANERRRPGRGLPEA